MNGRIPNDFRNILVAQTAFLGDLVLTTPLFRALKRLYPAASLTLLTTPQAAPLAEEDPHLDRIITYDKKGGETLLAAAKKLRGEKFDLMLAPHRSHRTSILGFLSRIPTRVGYSEAGFAFLHTLKVSRPMDAHEVDRILALLMPLGAKAAPEDLRLFCGFTSAEEESVDAVLRAGGVAPGERLAGLCPGSVWATKRWPAAYWAELADRLTGAGWRVALVGGPDDRETAAKVVALAKAPLVDGVGKTKLKALPAWLIRCGLFVTNDSAPLHVAAALGVPTVAIFGPTVKSLGFFPFHENSRVVEASLDCRPCGLHGHAECPEGHFRCMLEVEPSAVFAACAALTGEPDNEVRGAGVG